MLPKWRQVYQPLAVDISLFIEYNSDPWCSYNNNNNGNNWCLLRASHEPGTSCVNISYFMTILPKALLLSPLYRWENWGTDSILALDGLVSFFSHHTCNFLGLLATHVSHSNRSHWPTADNAEVILPEISVPEILTASLRLGLLVPSNGWEYLGSEEPCPSRAPK